jgi:ABC-2 type transport system ATP-binding protein
VNRVESGLILTSRSGLYLGRSPRSAPQTMAAAVRIRSVGRMVKLRQSSKTQPSAGLSRPVASASWKEAPQAAPTGSDPVISVSDLRMRYGDRDAVAGVSFEVRHGELLALLGPNGAGKTSTVEILEGYRRRSGGQVTVLGADPWRAGRQWRARIGVMLQETGPERDLTVAESLRLYGGYYPSPWPRGDLLRVTGLEDQAARRTTQLSGGQRRRLDLALALVGRPQVLFLDEPTTGFDPAARHGAWEAIASLKELGTTIILTTHYLEEAEHLADRVAILAAGRLVSQGTPGDLAAREAGSRITFTLPAGLSLIDLPEPARSAVSSSSGGKVVLSASSPLTLLGRLASWAEQAQVDLTDLEVRRPTLEDSYLQLSGGEETAATT